ncbi:DNA primase, partial [Streptacidiphilus pinicola]
MQHVEDTLGATEQDGRADATPGARDLLLQAAVTYAEDRHWEVSPGAWLLEDDGPPRCSCGDLGCPMPGAHPATRDWQRRASSGPG